MMCDQWFEIVVLLLLMAILLQLVYLNERM